MSLGQNRLVVAACVLAVFGLGIFVGKYLFEPTETNIPAHHLEEMSLLTWKGQSGELCFLIVPRIEQGNVIRGFWSKWRGRCGVSQLKESLAAVPRDKRVVWTNRPPKFELPSEKFCDQIVEFAKTREVKFSINPMLDTEMFSDWEPQ